MSEVYKKQLIPRQKDAFLCSARCCDASGDMADLQKWCAAGARGHAGWLRTLRCRAGPGRAGGLGCRAGLRRAACQAAAALLGRCPRRCLGPLA
jgi:hypothetical protein